MLKVLLFSSVLFTIPSAWAEEATAPASTAPVYNPAMATVPQVASPASTEKKATETKKVEAKPTEKTTEKTAEKTDTKATEKAKNSTQIAISKESYDRYQSLEKNNLETIAKNQELQMQNDSLGVQVQVLENERTAQLLFYGAMILVIGAIFGFMIGYFFARRQKPYL